jgi:hypothetical protein
MARKRKGGMPKGFVSKAQWRYFFANPVLRAKYAKKEAHKAEAAGGGPKVAYRHLPRKKGTSKRWSAPSGRRGK